MGTGQDHSVGVAFVDRTGDGWADLFVGNRSSASQFWVNTPGTGGDRVFVDRTNASNIGALLANDDINAVSAGDIDNDGDVDLYLGSRPRDILLRNDGSGTFTDATSSLGAGGQRPQRGRRFC